jgi:hypothetical protein
MDALADQIPSDKNLQKQPTLPRGFRKRSPFIGRHPAVTSSGRIPSITIFSRSSSLLLDATHSLMRVFSMRKFFRGVMEADPNLGARNAQIAPHKSLGVDGR